MLYRDNDGELNFKWLDFKILIGDLFEKCQTDAEICWLEGLLQDVIMGIAQEKRDGVL